MPFDPADDFPAVLDDVRLNTLKTAGGTVLDADVRALRRPVSPSDAGASDGAFTTSDVKWHLTGDDVSAAPEVDQRIVEADGTAWDILAVCSMTCGTRWQCVARRV